MILTRHHDISVQGFAAPSAGIQQTARHLETNKARFGRFVSSIMNFQAVPGDAQLAISVEPQQISLMTHRAAMSKITADYRFTAGLIPGLDRADLRAAMDYGILPYLASIQLNVRRINEIAEPSHPATAFDLQRLMNKSDEDVRVLFRILLEIQALASRATSEVA